MIFFDVENFLIIFLSTKYFWNFWSVTFWAKVSPLWHQGDTFYWKSVTLLKDILTKNLIFLTKRWHFWQYFDHLSPPMIFWMLKKKYKKNMILVEKKYLKKKSEQKKKEYFQHQKKSSKIFFFRHKKNHRGTEVIKILP